MTQWLATVATLVAPAFTTVLAQINPGARFEIEAGPMYGVQDPQRTVTPGWGLAGTFDLGGQTFVGLWLAGQGKSVNFLTCTNFANYGITMG